MNKKAQGLSLNVIIIAVIVLVVLVVLVVVFSGKMNKSNKEIDKTSKDFSASNCEIPGTGRECRSKPNCDSEGCSWEAADTTKKLYSDCKISGGCCSC